ncbi:MAG: hypothetical protein WDZ51_09725 [Pirellulaceae bacterium]
MARSSRKKKLETAPDGPEPGSAWGSPRFPVVWFWGILLLYAPLYFAASMPPLPTEPGQPPLELSRFQLLMVTLVELPTFLGNMTGEPADRVGIFDRVPILAITALMLAVAYTLGAVLLMWLRLSARLDRAEHFAYSLALGLTTLSTWTLLVGLAGLLHYPLLVTVPLVVVLILGGRAWKREVLESIPRAALEVEETDSPQVSTAPEPVAPGLGRWWWLFTIPLTLYILLAGMLPPYEYDVIEYHAQVPKEWFAAGRITHLPHNVYSGLPMGAELWALLPMIFLPWEDAWFTGTLVGKTILALLLPLTALLLWSAGKRLASPMAGQVAAIACLATPWLVKVSVQGLVDGAWAFFTLAAFYPILWMFLPQARKKQGEELPTRILGGLIVVSGLMAGMAIAIKYPALPLCAIPVAALLAWRFRTELPKLWRTQLLFWLAVLVVCGPWLAKNAWQTGNPVFPLAGNIFPSDIRAAENIAQWNEAHQVPADPQGNRYSLPQLFNAVTSLLYASPWTMLLLVPLGAMAWLGENRRVAWILLGIMLFHFAVWWLLSHRLERFWLPLFPLACLLAGLGAAKVSAETGKWGRLTMQLACGLVVLIGFLLLQVPPVAQLDPRLLVTLESLRLSQETSRSPAIAHLNESVPAGQTVLATGDSAPFYFRGPVLYHTCFDPSPLRPLVPLNADARRAWLAERRISHLYVHWGEIARFRSPGNYGFPPEVTPELFAELTAQQILGEPTFQIGDEQNPRVVVYPVRWEAP